MGEVPPLPGPGPPPQGAGPPRLQPPRPPGHPTPLTAGATGLDQPPPSREQRHSTRTLCSRLRAVQLWALLLPRFRGSRRPRASLGAQTGKTVKVKAAQWCPTLCSRMDYTALGILQTRILGGLPCPPPGDLPDAGINLRSPALQVGSLPAEPPTQETWVQSLGGEDPLEKGMVTHSSVLAWRTPWTEEPGGPKDLDMTE